MPSLFTIPKNSERNNMIAMLRMGLAIYILFFHAIPRYKFYGYDLSGLWDLQILLIKLLQAGDETNPVVIAFLVISGYCIHRNGLRLNNQNIHIFLKRRLLRIIPMLSIGTLLGIIVFNCLKSDPRIQIITNTQAINLGNVAYKFFGIFAWIPYKFEQSVHLGNGPLITCIVESWLYVFYPLGMWLIIKYGERTFCTLLLIILLSGVLLSILAPQTASWWHNGAIYSFLSYWWIGAFAVNSENKIYNYKYLNLTAYVYISVLLLIYPNACCIELRKVLLAFLVAAFLRWSEGTQSATNLSKYFRPSFSIYVLHIPLIALCLYWGINIWLAAVLIISLAFIAYKYIEEPMLNYAGPKLISTRALSQL